MTTALPGTGNDPLTQAVLGLTNGTLPLYPAGTRRCNARGMTELGRYAVQKLMEKKFIIDIDHAELSIKSDMIALQGTEPDLSADLRTRRPRRHFGPAEIGRASCRERVCQYV